MAQQATKAVSLGPVERTHRAFAQDAFSAMKGDIVRALVEYITNADDSYAKSGARGRILIEVEHKRGTEPWVARIRDRAAGMTLAEMKERIGKQGVRTSGFAEGHAVRGNLGLGSKDPAWFGKVTFESIKSGEYSWFAIDKFGERTAVAKPLKAAKQIRDELGITGNGSGTVVTILVTQQAKCPRHDTLRLMLSHHVLLRDIMQDPDRDVFLVHANSPKPRPVRLRYPPPATETRVNLKAVPLPNYPAAHADIVISETEVPFPDEGRRSPIRQAGLLIKGQRAIYESTLFGFEGSQHALAFAGAVRCADIDRIVREYDDRAERDEPPLLSNPHPIISRQRDGLEEAHPLYQAIRELAESHLAPLVAAREKRAKERNRRVENAETTKLLSQLAREAARFMQEAAEDEEIDLIGAVGKDAAPLLAIIPGALEMESGADRTVTLMAAKAGLDGDEPTADISFSPPGVVTVSSEQVALGPSRRRGDVLTATIKLTAGKSVGATMLNAVLGTRVADCAIDVNLPTMKPEPEPPTQLEFERSHYRLILNKPKVIKVRAPLAAYADGTTVKVTSNNSAVVVLDGGTTALHNTDRLAMEGIIRVEGRTERQLATITVSDERRHGAETKIEVVRREESGTSFETQLVPEYRGDQRAQWSGDYSQLLIMCEHPAIKPFVGQAEDGYPGQDTGKFQLLLAELVSDAVVRRILLEKHRDDELDAGSLYVHHYRLVSRLLSRAHKIVAATTSQESM